MRRPRASPLAALRAFFQYSFLFWLTSLAFSAEPWVRIGPDWRDEKPQTKFIVVPFQDWTAVFEINLLQRLNQLHMGSAELSKSRDSVEIKLYSAIVNRTTNDFPEEFSASLDFYAWRSADKRDGELLGKVKGDIHLNPKDSQSPITSTKFLRTIAGPAKVVFFYEWKMTIPLTETVDELPAYLEGWGACDCDRYEAGVLDPGQGTLLSYRMSPTKEYRAGKKESSAPSVALTSNIRLSANGSGKVRLSISQVGNFLQIDCSPTPGMKILERTALNESGLQWQAIGQTTNEFGVRWFVSPQHDNGIFRVRVE
jgi:hypothetical protein